VEKYLYKKPVGKTVRGRQSGFSRRGTSRRKSTSSGGGRFLSYARNRAERLARKRQGGTRSTPEKKNPATSRWLSDRPLVSVAGKLNIAILGEGVHKKKVQEKRTRNHQREKKKRFSLSTKREINSLKCGAGGGKRPESCNESLNPRKNEKWGKRIISLRTPERGKIGRGLFRKGGGG